MLESVVADSRYHQVDILEIYFHLSVRDVYFQICDSEVYICDDNVTGNITTKHIPTE